MEERDSTARWHGTWLETGSRTGNRVFDQDGRLQNTGPRFVALRVQDERAVAMKARRLSEAANESLVQGWTKLYAGGPGLPRISRLKHERIAPLEKILPHERRLTQRPPAAGTASTQMIGRSYLQRRKESSGHAPRDPGPSRGVVGNGPMSATAAEEISPQLVLP